MLPGDVDATSNVHQISSIDEQQLNETISKTWVDIEEERRNKICHLGLTRIVFVCCLISSDCSIIENAKKLHEIFTSTDDHDDPPMGGIVLTAADQEDANPCAAFGFLEFNQQRDVQKCMGILAADSTNFGFHSLKILLISHDNKSREFTKFDIYFASPPADDSINIAEYGPVAFELMMEKLYKHYATLVDCEEHPMCRELKMLKGTKCNSIPSANRIKQFAFSNCYPSPNDFVEIFDSPVDLKSGSDFDSASQVLPLIDWDEVMEMVEKSATEMSTIPV